MSSLFDPQYYELYRPLYPSELFNSFYQALLVPPVGPMRILDLGCGTGHSTQSLIEAHHPKTCATEWLALDYDPAMLSSARQKPLFCRHQVHFLHSVSHQIQVDDASLDGAIIGSALHWFDLKKTGEELARVLKPGAPLLLFEYQFPKCKQAPQLNEWIRRQFNLLWKAPAQKPRGKFKDLVHILAQDHFVGTETPITRTAPTPMILPLDASELAGLIFSQSRYLHYQNTLGQNAKHEQQRVLDQLSLWMRPGEDLQFDFNLCSVLLRKKPKPY